MYSGAVVPSEFDFHLLRPLPPHLLSRPKRSSSCFFAARFSVCVLVLKSPFIKKFKICLQVLQDIRLQVPRRLLLLFPSIEQWTCCSFF
ncbi:hypothetical protein NPIL_529211 [Nephila pilipes]|uniref:Uncharacterized protein n=1 Tax=Nephila pilipes TaxID=299642 RepID=A0A8X6UTX5_NEPPI|nr:hypothetical protein NPIL_529211 [Nephila pilipes]